MTTHLRADVKTLEGFAKFAERALADWKVPGAAVAVVQGGELVYAEGFGLRNVKEELEVTPETVFAIGSSSKAFTSMSLAMMVDDGKLEWDAPVRRYLPDFELYDPEASHNLTLRDMTCHRSGLPRHDLMWYNAPFSREEILHRLRYLEPSKGFRTLPLSMTHYHYDFFEVSVELGEITLLSSFATDAKGQIHPVSLPLEPSLAPKNIVFTRVV